jgi:hypothetical protein
MGAPGGGPQIGHEAVESLDAAPAGLAQQEVLLGAGQRGFGERAPDEIFRFLVGQMRFPQARHERFGREQAERPGGSRQFPHCDSMGRAERVRAAHWENLPVCRNSGRTTSGPDLDRRAAGRLAWQFGFLRGAISCDKGQKYPDLKSVPDNILARDRNGRNWINT